MKQGGHYEKKHGRNLKTKRIINKLIEEANGKRTVTNFFILSTTKLTSMDNIVVLWCRQAKL
jgi:hypothetical protein